jgi:hypothetical protein
MRFNMFIFIEHPSTGYPSFVRYSCLSLGLTLGLAKGDIHHNSSECQSFANLLSYRIRSL